MQGYGRFLTLFAAGSLVWLSACVQHGKPLPDAKLEAQNRGRLEQLKGLEGTWTGTHRHEGQPKPVTVTYRVTAGGSAVMETIDPGTPMEMVTFYTLDAGNLVLTHYCMLGNQPTMVAQASDRPNRIPFVFTGCGNLRSPEAPHMHDATLTLVDDTHLKAEWTLYQDEKPQAPTGFELERAAGP
jgi:hypothetical protein